MNKFKKMKIIVLLIFLGLMIVSAYNIVSWKLENNKAKKIQQKESIRLKEKNEEYYLDKNIKKENPFTIGWIKVDGTKINYPVLQYTDNDYYLNHDFDNNKNSTGWIFMDYQNTLKDENIVIYGHHRRDGSMFGSIDQLWNNQNKEMMITFITTEKTINYHIFSVYSVSSNDYYNSRNFNNFKETIKEFAKRSEISFHSDYSDANQIITLSTCHNNNQDRLVVHGYKDSK